MRNKLVAANWKMHFTVAEACATAESLIRHVERKPNVDVVICPPYTALSKLHDLLKGTGIALGAQNVFWMEKGAFTGCVAPAMLVDLGVTYCIVGHSETRGRFGKLEIPESTLSLFSETDETVNLKIRALLYHNIAPILCVGETLSEREAGKTDEVIRRQLRAGLQGIDAAELHGFAVAYEPVWAIGTGQTCDTPEANRVCGMVRSELAAMLGDELASKTRVLYGGSVKAANAKDLFGQSDIDGGLVGGASLDPQEFSRIIMSA
ncbi:MAG: triose-phosphate isomerase [Fimbriimonadaceae bacterium]